MDDCTKRQIPLRDTYISLTEPVNPYHGNYAIINLSAPYTLLLENSYTNLWQQQNSIWNVTTLQNSFSGTSGSEGITYGNIPAPLWSDVSRSFIVNTHTPRTWSNTSYWTNPTYYYTLNGSSSLFKPVSRSSKYPESQLGDSMFLHAILQGLGSISLGGLTSGPRYSTNAYGVGGLTLGTSIGTNPYGDPHWYADPIYGITGPQSFPIFGGTAQASSIGVLAPEDVALNNYINYTGSGVTYGYGINYVAGFNQTLFIVDAFVNNLSPFKKCIYNPSSYLTINIRPLVPYSDFWSGYLFPPQDWSTYPQAPATFQGYPDWNGLYDLESVGGSNGVTLPYTSGQRIPVLPQITANISAKAKCFYVTLPVQLYTLADVNYTGPPASSNSATLDASGSATFTFTLNDVNYGAPAYYQFDEVNGNLANMSVVAVQLKGVFLDGSGDPSTAAEATDIQFSIFSPTSPQLFTLSHTYEWIFGGVNRPIFCTETGSIPIRTVPNPLDVPHQTSLLFSPKCGPGIWSNLPAQTIQPGATYGVGVTFPNISFL